MRYTSKSLLLILITAVTVLLAGCGSTFSYAYTQNIGDSTFSYTAKSSGTAEAADSFARNLCVAKGDVGNDNTVTMSNATAAALFDVSRRETLFAREVHKKLYPASMTKVMTALVALKYGSTDQLLTADEAVYVTEIDAQLCGIQAGDTLTLDQALHLLLIYSANDAANLIAESIGGSVESFVAMMNDEARALGATNTNFVNPNGLHNDNHYTTAYDMYLIFNAAIQYDLFKEIINQSSYSTKYRHADGTEQEISVKSTNQYLTGTRNAPTGVTVLGGKTGTTNAAGHCLVMLSRNSSGNPYISVVMQAYNQDTLYRIMTELLAEIPN